MFEQRCPGAARIRSPVPEYFPCPKCGADVEIWSDEYKASCEKCGEVAYREKTSSCIQWCNYAVQCVGPTRYRKMLEELKAWEAQNQKEN